MMRGASLYLRGPVCGVFSHGLCWWVLCAVFLLLCFVLCLSFCVSLCSGSLIGLLVSERTFFVNMKVL